MWCSWSGYERLDDVELAQVAKMGIESGEKPVRMSLTTRLARLSEISLMGVEYDVEWGQRH